MTVEYVLAACDWYGIGRTVRKAIEDYAREVAPPTESDDE